MLFVHFVVFARGFLDQGEDLEVRQHSDLFVEHIEQRSIPFEAVAVTKPADVLYV